MAERRTSRFWRLLVIVAIASTALSIMGFSSEVQGVIRACCFPDADCQDLSRSTCEGMGGVSQTPGDACLNVTCPLLCGGSAPVCNGECPPAETCVQGSFDGAAEGGGAGVGPSCSCVPEIPQGGECEMIPDACAGGLPCENGVCCATECSSSERCDLPGSVGECASIAAAAPVVSNGGLIALVSILIALGGFTLMRRHRLD